MLPLNLGDEEFLALAEHQARPLFVPLCTRLPLPSLSTTDVYASLCRGPGILLESMEGSEKIARYSYLGWNPGLTVSLGEDVVISAHKPLTSIARTPEGETAVDQLRSLFQRFAHVKLRAPRFSGGMVGYFSYDLVHSLFPMVPRCREDSEPRGRHQPLLGLGGHARGLRLDDVAPRLEGLEHLIEIGGPWAPAAQPYRSSLPSPSDGQGNGLIVEILGKTNVDFIGKRNIAYAVSTVLVLLGILALVQISRGSANMGIDFAGGTSIQVKFDRPVDLGAVRNALSQSGIKDSEPQQIADGRSVMIRLKRSTAEAGMAQQVQDALRAGLSQ